MTFIEVNDNKMNFEIDGHGFPVVLIHGFSDDLHYWDHTTKVLKKYFTVIRIDLRGHGKTPIGEKNVDNHLLARDIAELLKKLYIEKCHVIGFSLGGSVAMDIALNNPKLVKSLVLISTFASHNDHIIAKFKELNKALKKSYETFFDVIIPYVMPKEIIEENIDKLNKVKELKASTENTEDLRKVLYGSAQYNELDKIKRINCKTLIIAAREDDLVPCENSLLMCERINKSDIALYDYVKHDVLIKSNREAVIKRILEFLRN
ncbi:MAG: alpha/beta hydrolase [Methanobrevibacter sp.]|uniref:alpha/beta fold hydrolase n=1 Tax=Methanobrevibacter sp. TaxID=66852 RepID=UPI0026DF818C|nr:alpha/beta hydrolase [Methanobrevibacter sp.]MDO5848361.1 alpha/beta hydrolase [Methanobrevibacter sp.]